MLSDSPPERDLQWTENGIVSSFKFVNRIWSLLEIYENYSVNCMPNTEILNKLKIKINDVSKYIEDFQFNKSVAKIYEYVNLLSDVIKNKKINNNELKWSLEKLSIILQPFLPHLSEEMWSNLKKEDLCINQDLSLIHI